MSAESQSPDTMERARTREDSPGTPSLAERAMFLRQKSHIAKPPESETKARERELANQFTLACGVRASDDVVVAAKIFRKQKTREFWNYMLFITVFSISTLQQVRHETCTGARYHFEAWPSRCRLVARVAFAYILTPAYLLSAARRADA